MAIEPLATAPAALPRASPRAPNASVPTTIGTRSWTEDILRRHARCATRIGSSNLRQRRATCAVAAGAQAAKDEAQAEAAPRAAGGQAATDVAARKEDVAVAPLCAVAGSGTGTRSDESPVERQETAAGRERGSHPVIHTSTLLAARVHGVACCRRRVASAPRARIAPRRCVVQWRSSVFYCVLGEYAGYP